MKFELSLRWKILLISLAISAVLVVIGYLSTEATTKVGTIGSMLIISTFIVSTPQLFLYYEKFRNLREMEEKFPHFLRDLTENLRSGMPFHKAIIVVSKIEYDALSTEIKKMAKQLSWGMPLEKVLTKFSERVRGSRRLETSINIIRESYKSGGDVVSTLESVADSSTMLRDSEKERKSMLNQYVVLMYAISLIFVVIVAVINSLLLPVFQTVSQGSVQGFELQNPCRACTSGSEKGPMCGVCTIYGTTARSFFGLDPASVASYYTSLFFVMAVIQSLFSGLIAGQISENSLTAGVKHSLILVGVTVGAFFILVALGFLGV